MVDEQHLFGCAFIVSITLVTPCLGDSQNTSLHAIVNAGETAMLQMGTEARRLRTLCGPGLASAFFPFFFFY